MSRVTVDSKPPMRGFTSSSFNRGVRAAPAAALARPKADFDAVDDVDLSGGMTFPGDIRNLARNIADIDASRRKEEERMSKEISAKRLLKMRLSRGEAARFADDKKRELAKLRLEEEIRKEKEKQRSVRSLARALDRRWADYRRKVSEKGDHPLLSPMYGKLETLARLAPHEFERYKDTPMVTSVSRKYVDPKPVKRSFADIMMGAGKSPLPTPQGMSVGSLDDLDKFFAIFGRTKYGRDHDPRPTGRGIITAWLAGNDDAYYAKVFWEYCSKRFSRNPSMSEFVPQSIGEVPMVGKLADASCQGQNQSVPEKRPGVLRVDVDVPVVGHQVLDVPVPPVMEVLKAYLPEPVLDKTKFQMIGSLIAMGYAMSAAPSWTMFMTQFGAFLGNHAEHFPRYMCELSSAFSRTSQGSGLSLPATTRGGSLSGPDAEALTAVFQPLVNANDDEWKASAGFMGKDFDAAMNSVVARAFFDLVGMMSISTIAATSGIFGDPAVALHFLGEVKKHLRKDVTVDTFSGTCFRVVKELGLRVAECIRTGSLKPLLENSRTPEDLRHYVNILLYHEEVLVGSAQMKAIFEKQAAAGYYPGDIFCQMTIHERDSRLRAVKPEVVLAYKVACQNDKAKITAPEWSRLLGGLEQAIAKRSGQEAAAKQRVQPFGLFLWGPPGTGKTSFMNKFVKVLAKKLDYPEEGQAVGTLQTDVNFQDTLYSHTWFIKCDDPGLTRVKPVAGVPTVSKLLCSIINREAFEFEKSDVSKKGSAFCSSKAVGVCNNKAGINVDLELTEPDALWRRLGIRILVLARPECVYAAGKALDPIACAQFGDPDVNLFYVEKFHSGASSTLEGGTGYPYLPVEGLYGTTDSKAVLTFLVDVASAHIRREEAWLANMIAGQLCDKCFHFHVGDCYKGDESSEESVPPEDHPWYIHDSDDDIPVAYPPPDVGSPMPPLEDEELQVRKGEVLGGAVALGVGILAEPTIAFVTDGGFARLRRNNFDCWLEGWMIDQLVKISANLLIAGGAISLIHGLLADAFESSAPQAGSDPEFAVPFAHSSASPFSRFSKEDIPFTSSAKARCVTLDSLEKTLQRSIMRIATMDPPRSMWCFLVTGDTIMFPRHLLLEDPTPDMCRIAPPVAKRVLVTPPDGGTVWHVDLDFGPGGNAWVVPDRDMVMVAVPKVPWKHMDMTPYLISSDVSKLSMFDEVRFLRPGATETVVSPKLGFMPALSSNVRGHQAYYPIITYNGECGLPVIARYGATVFIAGLHVGMGRSGDRQLGYAEFLPSAVVMAGLGRLSSTKHYRQFQAVVPSCFMEKVEGVDLSLPAKSSAVLAAKRAQGPVYVEATLLNQINGSTLKTKAEKMPVVGASLKMAKLLGYSPEDFGPPPFKGNMVESEWHDSYTRFFGQVSASVVDSQILEEALSLYETGMDALVGIGQVRVLTIYEAVRGIPGTGIRSINRATSSGAPNFVKKKALIEFDDGNDSVLLDDRLVAQIAEVEKILGEGLIPVPLATMGLKDEILDVGKISKGKVRLFTVLPTAFQIVLKRFLRPLCDLFRCNRDFFESYVGFNAADVDEVSAFLTRLKTGERLDDADYAFYDVKQAWEVAEAQARFWRKLSSVAGYTDVDQSKVYLLCLALAFILRLVKRELVSIVGINPSGSDVTTEWNSVNNSLVVRYAVCAVRRRKAVLSPPVSDWFRALFVLSTFGDDLVSSSTCDWCSFAEIAQEAMPLGSVITPGTKEGDFRALSEKEVVFLKRNAVRCPDIGAPTMALSKKSIAKMLFWRLKGELSVPDHQATALTGATREAFFHGKEFFLEFRGIALEMAGQLELLDNAHLRIPTFEVLRDDYLNRRNITWGVPEDGETQSLNWELHDNGDIVEATYPVCSESFKLEEITSPILQMSEVTQEIKGSHASPVTTIGPLSGVDKPVAVVDDVPIDNDRHLLDTEDWKEDDVLERPFVLGVGSFDSTTTVGSYVAFSDLFDRWKNQRASGNLAKIYSGARMDFEVWVTISSAATTGGFAVLSALPYGGPSVGTYPERSYQEDLGFLHSMVFFSSKPEGKLALPFYYNRGFVDDPNPDLWHVRFCLHSAVLADSDATPKVAFTVWARAYNVRLFNPKLQSSDEVKWSQVAAKLATLPLPVTARAGLSAISMAAGAMGYTRSNEDPEPNVVVRRMTSNTARVDGPDSSDVVAFLPSAILPEVPGVIPCTDGKELEFDTLCSRHGWIGQFRLLSTDVDTTFKGFIPVTPFLINSANVPGTQFRILPAGVAMLPFYGWRGGMEFTFISALSSLQRATIQVMWVPQWAGDAGPSKTDLAVLGTNSLYSATFELRSGTCHNFRVGWRSNQAFEPSVCQAPTFGDDLTTGTLVPGSCNGVLYVRVVNPIVGATTTAGHVQVYARCLPGTRPMPSVVQTISRVQPGTNTSYGGTVNLTNMRLQYGVFDIGCDDEAFEVPSISDLSPEVTSSERIDSARALMQRFSLVGYTPTDAATSAAISVGPIGQSYPMINTVGVTLWPYPFSWVRWYRSLFSGVRGSLRYRCVSNANKRLLATADVVANVAPTQTWVAAGSGGGAVQCLVGGENSLEYLFPDKNYDLYHAVTAPPGARPRGSVVIATEEGLPFLYHYLAAGPDVSVGGYIGGLFVSFI